MRSGALSRGGRSWKIGALPRPDRASARTRRIPPSPRWPCRWRSRGSGLPSGSFLTPSSATASASSPPRTARAPSTFAISSCSPRHDARGKRPSTASARSPPSASRRPRRARLSRSTSPTSTWLRSTGLRRRPSRARSKALRACAKRWSATASSASSYASRSRSTAGSSVSATRPSPACVPRSRPANPSSGSCPRRSGDPTTVRSTLRTGSRASESRSISRNRCTRSPPAAWRRPSWSWGRIPC